MKGRLSDELGNFQYTNEGFSSSGNTTFSTNDLPNSGGSQGVF